MWSYNPPIARYQSLGSSLFARHYSGNHYYFLFLSLLRCFSSGGWLPCGWYIFNVPGCPIRKSSDITLVCSSPKLIAAYHVLHRLSDPRHPPCALNCFKKIRNCVMLPPHTLDYSMISLSQYVKELLQLPLLQGKNIADVKVMNLLTFRLHLLCTRLYILYQLPLRRTLVRSVQHWTERCSEWHNRCCMMHCCR